MIFDYLGSKICIRIVFPCLETSWMTLHSLISLLLSTHPVPRLHSNKAVLWQSGEQHGTPIPSLGFRPSAHSKTPTLHNRLFHPFVTVWYLPLCACTLVKVVTQWNRAGRVFLHLAVTWFERNNWCLMAHASHPVFPEWLPRPALVTTWLDTSHFTPSLDACVQLVCISHKLPCLHFGLCSAAGRSLHGMLCGATWWVLWTPWRWIML